MNFARIAATLLATTLLAWASPSASAAVISYNTVGSVLSAIGVPGAVQNTPTSVTIGGLTLTYNAGSGSGVSTPAIINLGNIVTTGTSNGVSLEGLRLAINVNSNPPGSSGTFPDGAISGTISTNVSGAILQFSPNNISTTFGTLPGVILGSGNQSYAYQILNPTLGVQSPTVGNPVGQTTIQGAVSAVPEPTTLALAAVVPLIASRRSRRRNGHG